MKIEFLVDHVLRDLNVYSCIGRIIQEGTEDVEITYDHQDFRNRWSYYDFFERTRGKVDLIITPSYNVRRTPALYSKTIKQGGEIIVAHSEQIFSKEYYNEKFNIKYKKSYNRHVKAHIVWGKDFAVELNKYAGVDPEDIYIIGNPKLDLVKRQIRNSDCNNNNYKKKNILIVSDFLIGDYSDLEWKTFKARYDVESSDNLNQKYRQARENCIEWIIEASQNNPSKIFIMRKHPGEKESAYKKTNGFSNVKISKNRTFLEDLQMADIVFMFTSTSVFEVLVSGKKYYNMELIDSITKNSKPHYSLFNWVKKEEFMKIMESDYKYNDLNLKKSSVSVIDDVMHDPMGKSLTKMSIAIYEIAKKRKRKKYIRDYLWGYSYIIIPFIKNIIIKIIYFLSDICSIKTQFGRKYKEQYEEFLTSEEYMDNDIKDKSFSYSKELVSVEDILILKNSLYKIRKESEGIYIDMF